MGFFSRLSGLDTVIENQELIHKRLDKIELRLLDLEGFVKNQTSPSVYVDALVEELTRMGLLTKLEV